VDSESKQTTANETPGEEAYATGHSNPKLLQRWDLPQPVAVCRRCDAQVHKFVGKPPLELFVFL
jgi:hypothetical protein